MRPNKWSFADEILFWAEYIFLYCPLCLLGWLFSEKDGRNAPATIALDIAVILFLIKLCFIL